MSWLDQSQPAKCQHDGQCGAFHLHILQSDRDPNLVRMTPALPPPAAPLPMNAACTWWIENAARGA
jgi:hypothetical protein